MIECAGLSKSFGTHRALNRVSLSIAAGEFFSLLGPSGCGKTTLLRLIGGFESADDGLVRIDGDDVTALPPYRRPVNQVFQSYALFPHLTVEQNISFGLKMAGVPRNELRQRVAEAVALVSLQSFEHRKPTQLSGGQKQRVALARAIVNRPKVLLLDEPLAALDAQLRQAVQIELKQLQQRLGITFVFVTHDQDEAMLLSDRLAVMSDGSILQVGTPREVYEQPQTLAVAQFVGQANDLRAVRSADEPHTLQTAGGLTFSITSAPSRARVIIRPQGIQPAGGGSADFVATIARIIFRGETSHHILQLQSGETLLASGWPAIDDLAVDATVGCRIDPRHVHIFDEEGRRIDQR